MRSYNRTVTAGHASPEGTARLAARFAPARDRAFYRQFDNLQFSSVGLGTYLGDPDDQTDHAYTEAIVAAIGGGINFFDTAINYRHQRSERAIGAALAQLFHPTATLSATRWYCTKAGFLTPGAVPDSLKPADVVGNMHSMQPDFLADQIDRSRANLGLDTIDVFYLHNPETQFGFVTREEFERRIRRHSHRLERLVAGRQDPLLRHRHLGRFPRAGDDARPRAPRRRSPGEEGGADHHFRFIQLPFNLGMVEAYASEPESVLERRRRPASRWWPAPRCCRPACARTAGGRRRKVARLSPATPSAPFSSRAPLPESRWRWWGWAAPRTWRENLGVGRRPARSREQYLEPLTSDDRHRSRRAICHRSRRGAGSGCPTARRSSCSGPRRAIRTSPRTGRAAAPPAAPAEGAREARRACSTCGTPCARIEYRLTGSAFESARPHVRAGAAPLSRDLPRRCCKLRMPPYVKIVLTNEFPRSHITTHLSRAPGAVFRTVPLARLGRALRRRSSSTCSRCAAARKTWRPRPTHPGCIYGEMGMCLRPCQQVVGAAEYGHEVGARGGISAHRRPLAAATPSRTRATASATR